MSNLLPQQKREESSKLFNLLRAKQETQRLIERFGDKSWSEANRWWRGTAEVTSYVVNLISIVAAFYGVYWVMSFVSPWPALTATISLGLLIGLEALQRKSCDEFWDHKFRSGKASPGWLALKLSLLALAAVTSSFGTYQGTKDAAPKAAIVTQDSTLAYLQAQADQLNKTISSAQANKNAEGVTFYHSQRAVKQLSAAQTKLIGSITDRITATDAKNQGIEGQHLATVEMVASITMAFYILLEIIFQLAMRYMSLYDYRLYLELVARNPATEPRTQPIPSNPYTATHEPIFNNEKRPIGFKFPQATAPPLPIAENRGTTVATTPTAFPQPVGATLSHNSHTFIPEVVEDIEGRVLALCDKFKKEWPTRWRDRVTKGGDLSTMQANFTTWHDLLNTYLSDNNAPLSQKAFNRVQEFQNAYQKEILPTIKPTQP